MRWSRSFLETAPSVTEARGFVSGSLTAIPPQVRAIAALLVSELATNAVVHATSSFDVTIVFPTPSGRVRIEVTDADETRPTRLQPPPNVPHGRGLLLVASLSDDWGVDEAIDRPGKSVWFELSLSASQVPDSARAVTQREGHWTSRGLLLLFGARSPGFAVMS
jgi:hypothetical protein